MKALLLFLALGTLAIASLDGQQPAPVVLQALTPAPAMSNAAGPALATAAAGAKNTLQLLQEMQTTNAATLKKQEAALQTLEALQKAAEEIKIYSKRG